MPPGDPPLGELTFQHFDYTDAPASIRGGCGSSGSNRSRLVYVGHDDVGLCETP